MHPIAIFRKIRFEGIRAALWTFLSTVLLNRVLAFASIGNGTTNGRLRTNAAVSYCIAGQVYTKASTDDLWNLSALTTLTSGQFQAVALYLAANGDASIGAGTVSASAAAAIRALPTPPTDKCIVGVYVANASTNFGNALAAQGTIYNGLPSGYFVPTLVDA
jgi:hypothetical protein